MNYEFRWKFCGTLLTVLMMTASTFDEAAALIGGTSEHSDRFPATVMFEGIAPTDSEPNRHELCSATIIGEKAALTAGHCVDDHGRSDGGVGWINFPDGSSISVTCTRHPDYNNAYNDIALCRPADVFRGRREVVQTNPANISDDSSIVLLGYGCVTTDDESYGQLNWGAAGLRRKSKDPNPPSPSRPDDAFMIVDGGAVLCKGDSGSGAFDQDDPSTRFVIGVGIFGKVGENTSRLVQTTDGRVKTWLRAWGDDRGIAICGIHSDATGCR